MRHSVEQLRVQLQTAEARAAGAVSHAQQLQQQLEARERAMAELEVKSQQQLMELKSAHEQESGSWLAAAAAASDEAVGQLAELEAEVANRQVVGEALASRMEVAKEVVATRMAQAGAQLVAAREATAALQKQLALRDRELLERELRIEQLQAQLREALGGYASGSVGSSGAAGAAAPGVPTSSSPRVAESSQTQARTQVAMTATEAAGSERSSPARGVTASPGAVSPSDSAAAPGGSPATMRAYTTRNKAMLEEARNVLAGVLAGKAAAEAAREQLAGQLAALREGTSPTKARAEALATGAPGSTSVTGGSPAPMAPVHASATADAVASVRISSTALGLSQAFVQQAGNTRYYQSASDLPSEAGSDAGRSTATLHTTTTTALITDSRAHLESGAGAAGAGFDTASVASSSLLSSPTAEYARPSSSTTRSAPSGSIGGAQGASGGGASAAGAVQDSVMSLDVRIPPARADASSTGYAAPAKQDATHSAHNVSHRDSIGATEPLPVPAQPAYASAVQGAAAAGRVSTGLPPVVRQGSLPSATPSFSDLLLEPSGTGHGIGSSNSTSAGGHSRSTSPPKAVLPPAQVWSASASAVLQDARAASSIAAAAAAPRPAAAASHQPTSSALGTAGGEAQVAPSTAKSSASYASAASTHMVNLGSVTGAGHQAGSDYQARTSAVAESSAPPTLSPVSSVSTTTTTTTSVLQHSRVAADASASFHSTSRRVTQEQAGASGALIGASSWGSATGMPSFGGAVNPTYQGTALPPVQEVAAASSRVTSSPRAPSPSHAVGTNTVSFGVSRSSQVDSLPGGTSQETASNPPGAGATKSSASVAVGTSVGGAPPDLTSLLSYGSAAHRASHITEIGDGPVLAARAARQSMELLLAQAHFQATGPASRAVASTSAPAAVRASTAVTSAADSDNNPNTPPAAPRPDVAWDGVASPPAAPASAIAQAASAPRPGPPPLPPALTAASETDTGTAPFAVLAVAAPPPRGTPPTGRPSGSSFATSHSHTSPRSSLPLDIKPDGELETSSILAERLAAMTDALAALREG